MIITVQQVIINISPEITETGKPCQLIIKHKFSDGTETSTVENFSLALLQRTMAEIITKSPKGK